MALSDALVHGGLASGVLATWLLAACGGAPEPAAPIARPAPATSETAATLTPARYVLTAELGAMFDEQPMAAAEPAIVAGRRVLVAAGVATGARALPDDLRGFRSMPARLGGGFVLWSRDRTYRADAFLGPLEPVAGVGALGGVRPWLASILLRTERGAIELDPSSGSLRPTRFPGLSDAIAIDGTRGVWVDAFGRASVTTDAGASFQDVMATRGYTTTALREGDHDVALVGLSGRPALRVPSSGEALVAFDEEVAKGAAERQDDRPRRTLASELFAHAAIAGAALPGGQVLVASAGGLATLDAAGGQPVAMTGLRSSRDLSRCQPVRAGDALLAACTHEDGAHVLRIEGRAPALEATFPERSSFVAGVRGRFGFAGHCGREPPSVADFTRSTSAQEGLRDLGADDDARFCARTADGHWIERQLRGRDAARLYRFIPGDDGAVTALVLGGAGASAPAPGVRVVRIDPDDPALAGAAFPVPLTPMDDAPYRAIDTDYWQDAHDLSIHGWVLLPPLPEGEITSSEGEVTSSEGTPAGGGSTPAPRVAADDVLVAGPPRVLHLATRLGGRAAGLTIDERGGVRVHPLPEGVVEVVHGGRFALALATAGDRARYHESTDGGRTWRPVDGPPIGRLTAPPRAHAVHGCSEVGCTWNDGVVRLGWGGLPGPDDDTTAPREPPLQTLFADPPLSALACRQLAPRTPALPRALAPRKAASPGALRSRGGALVAFDAYRDEVLLASREPKTRLLTLLRIADVALTRRVLGRRGDGELGILSMSPATGEILLGSLDLARAEVAPLEALGGLATITTASEAVCARDTGRYVFVTDVRFSLDLDGSRGEPLARKATITASARLSAGHGALCLLGLEARLPEAAGGQIPALIASFEGSIAAPRGVTATCTLRRARSPGQDTRALPPSPAKLPRVAELPVSR